VQLTFVGHATTRLEIGGTVVVTDPVLRGRVAFLRSSAVTGGATRPPGRPVIVLVSHLHHDHCDLPSLRALEPDLTLVVPGGTATFFARHGFSSVVPLAAGESRDLGDITVTATDALHDGRRWPAGPPRRAVGYVVAADGVRVYFAGDTDLFDDMADLGRPDIALLPIWGWGRSLGPGHLDPARAAQAVDLIQPGLAVPIHWGTLRPFWHQRPPWAGDSSPAQAFAQHVHDNRLRTPVEVLLPGQSLTWPG
jgi:L-ascorbate metabolism protein UlaG (beta-lactamase superfamily)